MVGTGMTDYITIGKYKAQRTKLMGGKLQMRSHNNNQIHNLKIRNITKNIRDILLKLNKNEIIHFSDVDKLITILRQKYPDKAISRRQIAEWLQNQEVNQLYHKSKGKAKNIKSSMTTPKTI